MDSRVNQEHSNFAMFYWGYFNEMIHKFPSKILLLLPWGESSLWVNCVHFPKGGFLHAIIIIYLYCMVRNKEVLFPPHEYVVSFLQLLIVEAVWVEIFTVLTEGQEFSLEKIFVFWKNGLLRPLPNAFYPHLHPRPIFWWGMDVFHWLFLRQRKWPSLGTRQSGSWSSSTRTGRPPPRRRAGKKSVISWNSLHFPGSLLMLVIL